MSDVLCIRPADQRRWDALALGEVMLRFDPGDGRVRTARTFQVWEGGGEYNLVRGLRKCWGLRAAVATALPSNDLGWLAEDLIGQGGVDVSEVIWRDYDGLGRNTRMGLNFTERGFGVRPALGVSDRGYSAASQIRPGEFDWDRLFGDLGVGWFHTGGIFAALSVDSGPAALEAVKAARRHGVVVSFDLNYRASLWDNQDAGAAQALYRLIVAETDVVFGNEEAFAGCLGFDCPGQDPARPPMDPENFRAAGEALMAAYPGIKVVATGLRDAHTAGRNDWGGALLAGGELYLSAIRPNLEIYDRVGGGDAFGAGVAYGFLSGRGPQAAVDLGAAHGALAMTTPGDTSMANASEVEALVKGAGARVIR